MNVIDTFARWQDAAKVARKLRLWHPGKRFEISVRDSQFVLLSLPRV